MSRQTKQATLQPIPFARRVVFTAVMVLIPLGCFLAAEWILRAVEYGGDLDLVLRKTVGTREVMVINRAVAGRYFEAAHCQPPLLAARS